jgi:hypothetical protein
MTTGTNVAEPILVAGILILSIALLTGTEARAEKKCLKAATCLSWEAPTKYENGTELLPEKDLAGFNIYIYKGERKPDCPTIKSKKPKEMVGPKETSYEVDDLSSGTYFFAVTAVANNDNDNERESTCSNIEGKEI